MNNKRVLKIKSINNKVSDEKKGRGILAISNAFDTIKEILSSSIIVKKI